MDGDRHPQGARTPSPRSAGPLRWHARPAARAWRCDPVPAAVRSFHASLPGYAPTPLVELPSLAAELGVGRVFAKDETSRLGLPAFKVLGATWAVHRALAERAGGAGDGEAGDGGPRTLTLVCATDGNHGRAVARTARLLGHRATVLVAPGVHPAAVAAIRDEGATVVEGAVSYDDAVRRASELAARPGAILVQDMGWPGYEEIPARIVEGYATLCAEADDQLADAGAGAPGLVVVPVGVGSLAQAVVRHCRSRAVDASPAVLAVEPTAAACLLESLRRGALTSVATGSTAMAGLNCGTPSALAWPVLRAGLDAAVAIDDAAALTAMGDLATRGVQAGPCGAAALAGARAALLGPGARARRAALGVGAGSGVLLIITEGSAANPHGGPAGAPAGAPGGGPT